MDEDLFELALVYEVTKILSHFLLTTMIMGMMGMMEMMVVATKRHHFHCDAATAGGDEEERIDHDHAVRGCDGTDQEQAVILCPVRLKQSPASIPHFVLHVVLIRQRDVRHGLDQSLLVAAKHGQDQDTYAHDRCCVWSVSKSSRLNTNVQVTVPRSDLKPKRIPNPYH